MRLWAGGPENVAVLYDRGGVAVEKAYGRIEPRSTFAETVRTILHAVWPL